MNDTPVPPDWSQMSEEALSGMADWRSQHPHANLSEIEREVDARLSRLRARLIQDAAQASAAATWSSSAEQEVPTCPSCGQSMHSAGKRKRRLETSGGQPIELSREYARCPNCRYSFFPPR